jgi:hypothetical protein
MVAHWRKVVREAVRWFLYTLLLISLPFFLPILKGIIEGVLLCRYMTEAVVHGAKEFVNVAVSEATEWWVSESGISNPLDEPRPPFHLVELRDPRTWWQKLGMARFDNDSADPLYLIHGNYALFALDGLFKESKAGQEWHHWVYVSIRRPSMDEDGIIVDPWDAAFDELIQRSYVTPLFNNASLHHVSCEYFALCNLWDLNGASLLHFTTEETRSDDNRSTLSTASIPGVKPVFVRIIDFPLQGSLKMPGQAFPGELNQLRSVMENPDAWQSFKERDSREAADRKARKFWKYSARFTERHELYAKFSSAETWISRVSVFEKLGLSHALAWIRGVTIVYLYKSCLSLNPSLIFGYSCEACLAEIPLRVSPEDVTVVRKVLRRAPWMMDKIDALNSTPTGQKIYERMWEIINYSLVEEES